MNMSRDAGDFTGMHEMTERINLKTTICGSHNNVVETA